MRFLFLFCIVLVLSSGCTAEKAPTQAKKQVLATKGGRSIASVPNSHRCESSFLEKRFNTLLTPDIPHFSGSPYKQFIDSIYHFHDWDKKPKYNVNRALVTKDIILRTSVAMVRSDSQFSDIFSRPDSSAKKYANLYIEKMIQAQKDRLDQTRLISNRFHDLFSRYDLNQNKLLEVGSLNGIKKLLGAKKFPSFVKEYQNIVNKHEIFVIRYDEKVRYALDKIVQKGILSKDTIESLRRRWAEHFCQLYRNGLPMDVAPDSSNESTTSH